jgi:hypothetical protein
VSSVELDAFFDFRNSIVHQFLRPHPMTTFVRGRLVELILGGSQSFKRTLHMGLVSSLGATG